MALKAGFTLKCLRATGKDHSLSELRFTNGLNVISGASDTGKSYILECIDFMYGSDKLPRRIEESKQYDFILLEIEDKSGKQYTLERKS